MELFYPYDVETQTKARHIAAYEGIDNLMEFAEKYGTDKERVERRLKEIDQEIEIMEEIMKLRGISDEKEIVIECKNLKSIEDFENKLKEEKTKANK